jgi:hypothetical protein
LVVIAMRHDGNIGAVCAGLLSLCFALAFSLAQCAAQATTVSAPPDTSRIESLFHRYEASYVRQDYDEILKIWPSLESDSSESKRLKERFKRADFSDVKLNLEILDVTPLKNGIATVHCKRREQYEQVSTSTYYGADNTIGRMPAQNGGPAKQTSTRTVKKTSEVWVMVNTVGDDYVIRSMSQKKP